MNTRVYLIVPVVEANKLDFSELATTSQETALKSIDQTKMLVKWDGQTPQSVLNIEGSSGPYTYEEIASIISSSEWFNYTPPGA